MDNSIINYRNTLNLPNTKFPMRANLSKKEPLILEEWNKNNLYKIIRDKKKGKKVFFLHDGPPYANGKIHIGHAVNKILKDIIIKSKGLTGYDSPYIPGWDCHGLPIEIKIEQLIGKPNNNISANNFRTSCRNYVIEQVNNQKKDFIRLGILGDWNNPYLTMDFITEANIIRILSKLIEKGYVYKGYKPIHWCIHCCSALAESEIEYYDYISDVIDVTFSAINKVDILQKFGISNFLGSISLVIWTTTPWTLPANRAITIHPDLIYCLVSVNGQGLILSYNLVEKFMHKIGVSNWVILGKIKGKILELCWFRHPFMNFNVPSILGYHVTSDVGTGAVHTAPGHGPEDYFIAKKYNLSVISPISADGYYLPGTYPSLDGLHIFKSNNVLLDLLNKKGALLHRDRLQHSYQHCWRHKTPLIFRVTPQWFVKIDHNSLREKSIKAIQKVEWIPNWGKIRIEKMVYDRPDWCISRQNIWGIPITLFIHNETDIIHPRTIEFMETIAKKVEKIGIQAWWDLDPYEMLGDDANSYTKVVDTLDVWFDSGSTNFSVIPFIYEKNDKNKSDLCIEGSDQYRGWFMAALIISTIINGEAPYKKILTHGFTVDSNGKKMSKSIGNIITPQSIVEKFGADVLRFWVASTDYSGGDISISDNILKYSSESYRRIRNIAKFLLSNLYDFDPILNSINYENMVIIDRWIVGRANTIQKQIISYYEQYDFHNVIKCIMQFCSVEMSSFYLDIIKDRQYTIKVDSIARRSCQTAFYHIIEAFVRWIAPIMSFTADEIWKFIPGKRENSVFTEEWYENLFELKINEPMGDSYWNTILKVRNEVNKIIEEKRCDKQIGGTLEANITLYTNSTLAKQLLKLGKELRFIFMTSSAVVVVIDKKDDFFKKSKNNLNETKNFLQKIVITKAEGKKCSRCWHYELNIGNNYNYPDICDRCIINISGSGEDRKFV